MIPCQRHLFDIPPTVTYFNCAYLAPLSKAVVEAGERGLRRKARPWTITAADFFSETEDARELFARLVGASAEEIAVIPAASYGVSVAAANVVVNPGQRILVLAEQFPSHVYPWRERANETGATIDTIAEPADGDWTAAIVDRIDGDVAVAALPHCRWTDGALIDLERVGARLREVGAALAVDATQSLGALPFDVERVRPNFLVAACYKWLLGPYSIGFMYVDKAHHQGRPLEHNWIHRLGAEDFAGLVDYRDDYQPGARRYDVGERANFALMPAAMAALKQILIWGVPEIQETLSAMTREIAERGRVLGMESLPEDRRAGHFLGLRFPDAPPAGLLERLAREEVHVSVRGKTMRITPHVYNNADDVDRLFDVLKAAVR